MTNEFPFSLEASRVRRSTPGCQQRAESANLRALVNALGAGLARFSFRGKWRLVNNLGKIICKVCPGADCFPHPQARVSLLLEHRVERLMWAGCYEQELVSILKSALQPGMVFVDIGAHVGY